MEARTPNETACIIPVKNSVLYRTILSCAIGRWQKNKLQHLLKKGWMTETYTKKDKYDYNKSLIHLTDRIQAALKETDLYFIQYVQIINEPKTMGYILSKDINSMIVKIKSFK